LINRFSTTRASDKGKPKQAINMASERMSHRTRKTTANMVKYNYKRFEEDGTQLEDMATAAAAADGISTWLNALWIRRKSTSRLLLRYDTIRYVYVRLKADKMASLVYLAHGTKTKKLKEKAKNKNRLVRKKRCRQKSVKAVWEEEIKLRGVGFVKEVGFKPGVKEKELWMSRVVKLKRKSDR